MAMPLNPRGVPNKVLYGESLPQGPTPHPFTPIPSVTKGIDKWYPFHIPCLKLRIPYNC